MKINEIIRERRRAKDLTQEQVAFFLGVSAPAVNKWEKSVSYPDITLLPALARLLDTDLNTLLSFKEDLTEQEIGYFLNELVSLAANHDLSDIYNMAMDKIHEYPNCDSLLLNTALTLEGIFIMYPNKNIPSNYYEETEQLYERAAKSCQSKISNQAKSMLISKYISRQDYEQAEQLLEELPDINNYCNKKQLQINLYKKQGELEKAIQLTEEKIYFEVNDLYMTLDTLMEMKLEKTLIGEAKEIADKLVQLTNLFDLWEYNLYLPKFQLSVAEQDVQTCIQILEKMLPAMLTKWNFSDSFLYQHIKVYQHIKENKEARTMGQIMIPNFIHDIENPDCHECEFLRESQDFRIFLNDIKVKYKDLFF